MSLCRKTHFVTLYIGSFSETKTNFEKEHIMSMISYTTLGVHYGPKPSDCHACAVWYKKLFVFGVQSRTVWW
jgi:hypothetical protein